MMRSLSLKTSLLVFLFAFFAGSSGYAQSSTAGVGGSSVYKDKKSRQNREDFNARIDFDLTAINYMEESPADHTFQQKAQIGLNFKKSGTFFSESTLILGTTSEPNSFYYAFPEFYAGYGSQDANVTVGRKIENLSVTDSFFHFGMLQSFQTIDFINYVDGGLTGITGHLNGDGMGVMASFDPIFIPNQGPEKRTENGRIISTNRWSHGAPSKFKFGDDYKDINYTIADYKITDIISHSGYTLNAYLGDYSKKRPLLNLTYANKPVNEVAHSRDTYSDISNLEGYVYLTPVVLMHTVQSMDVNLDYENFKSTLSLISDQPVNQTAQDQEYIQTLEPIQIVGIYTALDMSKTMGRPFEVYAGFAQVSGGAIKDLNKDGKENEFVVIPSRSLYKQPMRLGMKGDLVYIYNRTLDADVSVIYDQQYKGSLLSMKLNLAASRDLKIGVGADLIGVENDLPEDAQGNFLDQHKADDRIFAGLNYAF